MKNNQIRKMCIAGILTALVYVFTAYLHIPIGTGYTHIGDGFIYLAACILPLPYAMFVGAGGALLADCMTGYALWAPASLVIKAVTVLFFSRKGNRIITLRNLLALLPAWALCVGGYYLYEAMITGDFVTPLSYMSGNVIQSIASSALYIAIGLAMDKLNGKNTLLGNR